MENIIKIGDTWKEGSRWKTLLVGGAIATTRTKKAAMPLAEGAREADRMNRAVREYYQRQNRKSHPDGRADKAGRWYPSASERQSCCNQVRQPTRSYPWSLMVHCRTARHIACLYDVSEADLRKAGRKAPAREGGEAYYKAVAVMDGRWLSIYDGQTEYEIGVTLSQRTGQGHAGGYYVYASRGEAEAADVPSRSSLKDADRIILRVRAEGSYCRYGHKLSFSQVTPLEAVA